MKRLLAVALLLSAATVETPQVRSQSVEITEWDVPWQSSRPRDPYVAPDGVVWFVGQKSHYVATLNPETGEFGRIDLEAGAGPHNIVVDASGNPWYAGNLVAHIGRIDPETGEIHKIGMPDPAVRDPHTLVFDSNGDIWFSAQGGNAVGFLEVETEAVTLFPVPTPRSRPYGIVVDGNDRPWFTEFGTNKLGTVDPETMELEEIVLPREGARPRRLVADSKGLVWYVDYAEGVLGRYDPDTGSFKEWPTPGGGGSRPYGMAIDESDRIWFVESGLDPNRLVGFNPSSGEFFSLTEIGSGGGTVRHMYYNASDGTVWFGTDTNTIGRARVQ